MDKVNDLYECVGEQEESAQDECGFSLEEDGTSCAHVHIFLIEQMRHILL